MCNALKRPQMMYSTGVVEKAAPVTFLTEDEKMMKETGTKFIQIFVQILQILCSFDFKVKNEMILKIEIKSFSINLLLCTSKKSLIANEK